MLHRLPYFASAEEVRQKGLSSLAHLNQSQHNSLIDLMNHPVLNSQHLGPLLRLRVRHRRGLHLCERLPRRRQLLRDGVHAGGRALPGAEGKAVQGPQDLRRRTQNAPTQVRLSDNTLHNSVAKYRVTLWFVTSFCLQEIVSCVLICVVQENG